MISTHTRTTLLLTSVLLIVACATTASAGNIVHTGGGADLTFFYDSNADRFDAVYRPKGNAVSTGGTPYTSPPGVVGGSASDLAFDSLNVINSNPGFRFLNGNGYYTMGPSSAQGQTDLGIRTRFRELDPMGNVVDQFDEFQMELDWANSNVPAGAEFAMWNVDSFGDPDTVRFETTAGNLTSSWPVWGHSHWIYGFSQMGTYDLTFNIQGFLNGSPVTSPGSVNFSVSTVPEPTTTSLLLLAMGCLATGRRSRRRRSGGLTVNA